ncbi:hypothetical protein MMC21_008291 [Puttea exsequens]|nr:hypothetical protein [Puttea exsequens]
MHAKQGAEFNTKFQITPALPSVRIQDLVSGSTEQWVQWDFPWHPKSLLKPYTHFRFFIPTNGPLHLSLTDVWITPKDDDAVFTTRTLGMIADIWPRMVENYCPDSGWNTANLANRAKENAPSSAKAADFSIEEHQQAFWYPTLSMTLDVKKTLEPHGVKWLFMRAQARQIKNGRMDVTVVILDQRLELVAISNHVCLVISNANGPLRRLPHYEQVKL